ncbi:MAG TPA: DUF3309 family protein [Dongiaceae bacterium]|nr:DUF3309 family protein [Dongiaceae bacterium]
MLSVLVVVVLAMALMAVVPVWPHSRAWGYMPGSVLGALLLVILILALFGRI